MGALAQTVLPFKLEATEELLTANAGVSSWHGRERCNDFPIGVELEGTDDLPYEDIQYEQLARPPAPCRPVTPLPIYRDTPTLHRVARPIPAAVSTGRVILP